MSKPKRASTTQARTDNAKRHPTHCRATSCPPANAGHAIAAAGAAVGSIITPPSSKRISCGSRRGAPWTPGHGMPRMRICTIMPKYPKSIPNQASIKSALRKVSAVHMRCTPHIAVSRMHQARKPPPRVQRKRHVSRDQRNDARPTYPPSCMIILSMWHVAAKASILTRQQLPS